MRFRIQPSRSTRDGELGQLNLGVLLAIVILIGNLFLVPLAGQSPDTKTSIARRSVPSIKGKSPQEVNAILRPYDLIGKLKGTEPSKDYPPGTVNRQYPPGGAPIPHPGVIQYWLAAVPVSNSADVTPATKPPPPRPSRPDESFVTVPNVKDMEPKRGLAELKKARLVGQLTGKERSKSRVGTIADQNPKAGTRVRPGSKVEISLSPTSSWWDWKSYPRIVRLEIAILMGALTMIAIRHFFPPAAKVEFVLARDRAEQKVTAPGPLTFPLEFLPVVDQGIQELYKVGSLIEGGP